MKQIFNRQSRKVMPFSHCPNGVSDSSVFDYTTVTTVQDIWTAAMEIDKAVLISNIE